LFSVIFGSSNCTGFLTSEEEGSIYSADVGFFVNGIGSTIMSAGGPTPLLRMSARDFRWFVLRIGDY
jgi:hypothetical protein